MTFGNMLPVLAFALAIGGAQAETHSAADVMISPQQFKADVQTMLAGIDATHPQLSYTVNLDKLHQSLANIVSHVQQPLSRDEAWRRLATLNPIFSDGHLLVGFADWHKQASDHLASGGRFFPYEMHVDAAGKLMILSRLGGGHTDLDGSEVSSINGVPASTVAATLLARTHGDTPTFRAALLSRRWWWYYWKMYGAPTRFELVIADAKPTSINVPASAAVPDVLQDDQSFERNFQFRLMPPHAALLTIKSFYWNDKPRYFAFMKDAFARIKAAGVTTLVIDIRDNGGGDDDMWMRGILQYVADKPYRWASTYKKKIIEKYRDAGETDGEVKTGTIDNLIQPEPHNPLAYRGKTYVLIGPYTYSSAILFTNVVEDYGFATVAGTGGAAKRGQTGGIQSIDLPNSGLVLTCPRFYLLPPAGGSGLELVEPQIPLHDDPLHPEQAVRALLQRQGHSAPSESPKAR